MDVENRSGEIIIGKIASQSVAEDDGCFILLDLVSKAVWVVDEQREMSVAPGLISLGASFVRFDERRRDSIIERIDFLLPFGDEEQEGPDSMELKSPEVIGAKIIKAGLDVFAPASTGLPEIADLIDEFEIDLIVDEYASGLYHFDLNPGIPDDDFRDSDDPAVRWYVTVRGASTDSMLEVGLIVHDALSEDDED